MDQKRCPPIPNPVFPEFLPPTTLCPYMILNDLEGQNNMVYNISKCPINVNVKNQVNQINDF